MLDVPDSDHKRKGANGPCGTSCDTTVPTIRSKTYKLYFVIRQVLPNFSNIWSTQEELTKLTELESPEPRGS